MGYDLYCFYWDMCMENGGSFECNDIYIYQTQIDVQSLIDIQSSNRRPILKYMAVFYFLKSTSNYITDVYFKWRHTR
jgi:hypothetical protein